jgi:peptidoglycan/LPS O-acetylase OafA/YrhL
LLASALDLEENSILDLKDKPQIVLQTKDVTVPTEKKKGFAGRTQALDLLRALAIGLVLFRHMSLFHCSPRSVLGVIENTIFRGGWIGVDVFFVLSGFLVSGLLFREHEKFGSISFRQFFIRRGFKIYPPYWTMLALGAVVLWCTGHQKPFLNYLYSLVFLQNYGPFVWGPTWSLGVEEHFYIGLPLLLMALASWRRRKSFNLVPLAFVFITSACTTMRLTHALCHDFSQEGSVFPTHLRIDALFYGVLISYWYHYNRASLDRFMVGRAPLLAAVGAALLLPAFFFDQAHTPFMYTLGFNMLYLGSGFLLMSALTWRSSKAPFIKALSAIGADSYSIYLWHPIVNCLALYILCDASPLMWTCYLIAYLGGSVVFGMFMARIVEKPALMLRDRLVPSRAR